MIDCRSSMLSRFINGILRRRPGMLGLDHLTGGTLSSGHRPLVHFQLATGGTFWVATEASQPFDARHAYGLPSIHCEGGTTMPPFVITSIPGPSSDVPCRTARSGALNMVWNPPLGVLSVGHPAKVSSPTSSVNFRHDASPPLRGSTSIATRCEGRTATPSCASGNCRQYRSTVSMSRAAPAPFHALTSARFLSPTG